MCDVDSPWQKQKNQLQSQDLGDTGLENITEVLSGLSLGKLLQCLEKSPPNIFNESGKPYRILPSPPYSGVQATREKVVSRITYMHMLKTPPSPPFNVWANLVPRDFFPLEQRSEKESSGSNHFKRIKE